MLHLLKKTVRSPFYIFLLTGIQIICVTNTVLVFPALLLFLNMFALQPAINQFLPSLKNLLFLNFIIQFFSSGILPFIKKSKPILERS